MKLKNSLPGRILNRMKTDPGVNASIIFMFYLFMGINCVGSGIHGLHACSGELGREFIALGAILLIMCPISLADRRKEMQSPLTVSLTCLMHLGIGIFLSYTDTVWFLAVCFLEMIGIFLFTALRIKRRS